MFKSSLKKLPAQTIEITATIPWADIKKEYDLAFDRIHAQFVFEGFRKGKVPKEIALKQISPKDIYQELIRKYIPEVYEEVVKKEGLKPIVSPKVQLVKAEENKEWEVKITVAEKPIIKLGDYKKYVQEVKANNKKNDIWVPGKDPSKKEPAKQNNDKLLQDILNAILTKAECEISPLLIESELEKRLTQLVDDVSKAGLTMENYLKSKNITQEKLKETYSKEIMDMYKLEFILSELAEVEKIEVTQKDIDAILSTIKDEKDKAAAQKNMYFYASFMRKQKTLDYLISL